MKKTLIITALISLAFGYMTAQSASESRQILVFRNTGEINVLQSGEISKIELSRFDNSDVEHDEYVSQIFYRNDDTRLVVPLSEIDSVAFGVRNFVVPKPQMRRLTDDEASAISSFDGVSIRYAQNTASSLIVKAGEYVYYDAMTETLPYGLCAHIKSVSADNGVSVATLEELDPADAFEKYLYTGEEEVSLRKSASRAIVDDEPHIFNVGIPATEINGTKLQLEAKAELKAEFTNVVVDIPRHYYHANIKLSLNPEMLMKISSDKLKEVKHEGKNISPITIPVAGKLLSIDLPFCAFIDLAADLGLEWKYSTEFSAEIEWTRQNGKDTYSNLELKGQKDNGFENKIEMHLNGEIFAGVKADLKMNILFDRLGAGAELKFGPAVEGELSLGVIERLSEKYDKDAYAKGQLRTALKAKGRTYVYHREHWGFGSIKKTYLPFEPSAKLDLTSLNLFPEFSAKAVLARCTEPLVQTPSRSEAIDISVYTTTDTEIPLTIGFELANSATDETIVMADETNIEDNVIAAHSPEYQQFDTEIPLPANITVSNLDNVVARPTFKYLNHTIKAKHAAIGKDMGMSTMISGGCSSGINFIYGMTPVSQTTVDNTTYIVGNICPVTAPASKFRRKTAKTLEFIEISNVGIGTSDNSIVGAWSGRIAGTEAKFVFSADGTGNFNDTDFTYRINGRQTGCIDIILEDYSTITMYVVAITPDTMTVMPKKSRHTYQLNRI